MVRWLELHCSCYAAVSSGPRKDSWWTNVITLVIPWWQWPLSAGSCALRNAKNAQKWLEELDKKFTMLILASQFPRCPFNQASVGCVAKTNHWGSISQLTGLKRYAADTFVPDTRGNLQRSCWVLISAGQSCLSGVNIRQFFKLWTHIFPLSIFHLCIKLKNNCYEDMVTNFYYYWLILIEVLPLKLSLYI